MVHKLVRTTALAAAIALPSNSALAAEGRWKYSLGSDFSSGDYGGDPVDTDITFLPFSVSYATGKWNYKATLSWLEIDGPGNVIGGGGDGIIIDNGNTTSTTESGLGDIWLGASYDLDMVPRDWFYLNVGGKLKLPTADEDKRLGTGEIDYSLVADAYKPMGRYTPFVTLTYKIKGDPPEGDLDNVFALSAGSDYRWDELNNFGASLDYQQSATDSDDALELFGYFNRRLSQQTSVMLYGYTGLMDGSPDYGLGMQITYRP